MDLDYDCDIYKLIEDYKRLIQEDKRKLGFLHDAGVQVRYEFRLNYLILY